MKKVIVLLSFLFVVSFAFAQKQSQGIGLRLGDPLGVTYKKYFNKKAAFEFVLGTSSSGWGGTYYRNAFDGHDLDGFRYYNHDVLTSVTFQGRYLIHNNIYIQGMEGNWDWYWGVGAVVRVAKVRYWYEPSGGGALVRETYSDFDLGPDGIAGMEYTFEKIPLSVFAEVSLMIEVVDRLSLRPLSGAGARYRF